MCALSDISFRAITPYSLPARDSDIEIFGRASLPARSLYCETNPLQTFDADASNRLGDIEKSPVAALNDELFGGRNRRSVSITVAAENHSSSNAPQHEVRPAKGFEFNRAEAFSEQSRAGITRVRPVTRHQAFKQGRPNGNGK
jgi:hypothetical protein